MRKLSATLFTAAAIGALSGASAHAATTPAGSPTAKVDGTGTAVVTAGVGTSSGYKVWMGCYDGGRCFFHVGLATGKAGPRPVLGSACFNWSSDSTEWVFFCDTYGSGGITSTAGVTFTFGNGNDDWSVRYFGGWPNGAIKVYGGGGADRLDAGGSTGLGKQEKLYGQAGADVLVGSGVEDVLSGGAGNDHINGWGGYDVVRGGAGADDIYQAVLTDNSPDRIEGDGGDDKIFGSNGNDVIDGGTGNDHINGGAGKDDIDGGDGADVIDIGEVHGDTARGGSGNDQIFSSVGPSGGGNFAYLYGGAGNDKLGRINGTLPTGWMMFLVGGEGNDTLYANDGWSEWDLDCGDGTGDVAYIDDPQGNYDQPEECETVH